MIRPRLFGAPGPVSELMEIYGLTHRGAGVEQTASGAIASFETALAKPLRSLITDIDPVQDLHGQDAPYPGGGGKNKLPTAESTTHQGVKYEVNADGSVTVSQAATGASRLDIGRDELTLPAGEYFASGTGTSNATITIFKIVDGTATLLRNGTGAFTLTESTSVFMRLSFSSGTTASGTAYPQIELGNQATSYAPYSNICPISGWNGCEVYHTGKNLWPFGNLTANAAANVLNNAPISLKAGQYYLRFSDSATRTREYTIRFNYVDGGYLTQSPGVSATGQSFTFTKDVSSITWYVREACNITNIQLELGSTASTYEAYTGDTYPITWQSEAGTVYGGTLNVTTGVLTVDKARVIHNGSEGIVWSVSESYPNRFTYTNSDIGASGDYAKYKCNCLTPSAWGATSYTFAVRSNGSVFIMLDGNAPSMTVAEFNEYLSEHPIEIVYELAEPLTYHIDPVAVRTLKGRNNIWSNSGDVTVTYLAKATA